MAASLRIAAATASRAATARGGCALPAAAVAGARAASSSSSGSSSSSSSSSNPMPDPPERSQPAPAPAQAEAQAQAQATQQPSFATSASTLAAQAAAKPLPFLSSAPGFPFPPACIANAPTPPSSSSFPSSRTASLSSSPASSSTGTGTGTGTGAASGSTASTAKPSASSSKMQAREARIYAERKAIVAEATKGYFHDFHALRAHGGKTWRAPSSLIRAERARWWPDWTGRRLSDGSSLSTAQIMRGRTSVVSVLSSQASEEHVRSFVRPTVATFATHPGFQHVRINVQLSALRAFLLRIVFNSLRASVGAEAEKEAGLQGQGSGMQEAAERAQRTYFLCTAAPEVPARVLEMELEAARQRAAGGASPASADAASSSSSATTSSGTSHSPGAEAFLRSALCLHNKHVGYVFLVDAECKIRWAGCAFAEEAEREALRACTGVLLARH